MAEIVEVMKKVAELSITSESNSVQLQCRQVCILLFSFAFALSVLASLYLVLLFLSSLFRLFQVRAEQQCIKLIT